MNCRILAIDVGTHAARAAIVDAGQVALSATVPVALRRIDQVRVEQNPAEILAATQAAVRDVLTEAAKAGLQPHGAALATQRSTVLAWNRHSGEALSPALSWQDTRTADQVAQLREYEQDIKRRSGLSMSPHYGASKLHWLLHQEPALEPADVCLGPLVSYLLFHLLDESPCVCDESNAARTQLWNLRERQWDDSLCHLFGVPQAFLPALLPIQANYGKLRECGLPLTAVCGDQNAAFFAFANSEEGTQALVNAGSGAFVLAGYAGDIDLADKLLVSLYRSDHHTMDLLVEGTVNGAGTALDWFYDRAIAATEMSQQAFYDALPRWLAAMPQPPLFLNSIGGLGSPWWKAGPEPRFVPELEGTSPIALAEQATAVVESIVFLLYANIRLMQQLQPSLQTLLATGGIAKLDGFCQKLANLSGLPVQRPGEVEATVVGAAALAAAEGVHTSQPRLQSFSPQPDAFLQGRFSRFVAHLSN